MKKILFYLLAVIFMIMAISQAKAYDCPTDYTSGSVTMIYGSCTLTIDFCYKCFPMLGSVDIENVSVTINMDCAFGLVFDDNFWELVRSSIIPIAAAQCAITNPCPDSHAPVTFNYSASCYHIIHPKDALYLIMEGCTDTGYCTYQYSVCYDYSKGLYDWIKPPTVIPNSSGSCPGFNWNDYPQILPDPNGYWVTPCQVRCN